MALSLDSLSMGVQGLMRAQVVFSTNLWHPQAIHSSGTLSHTLISTVPFTKSKRLPPPPPRCSKSDVRVKVTTQHCFWRGPLPTETPLGLSPLGSLFSEGAEASFRDNKMQCVCDLLFWSRRDLENYLIQVRSEPQNHSVCINTSSGSFVSVIFPSLPLAPLLEFSGRLVGETLVRVLFSIFLLFWAARSLCVTKTTAQLCLTLYFDCWGKNKIINVYVAVCSEVCRMRRPVSLTSQGAGGALSSPSPKSSREFKHKPICERIFCLSVIHFSVGLPSQTSGVLLASKLACVSIRRTDRLSIVKGMRCCCCFLFFFPCISPVGRSGGSCVIPVSHVLTWGGGRGMGNYSNIYRCFGDTSAPRHYSYWLSALGHI